MKKFYKVAALILTMVLVVGMFASCSNSHSNNADLSDLDYVKQKGKITIGITEAKPMNYYDENDELIGFDTEFAKLVCEKLGVEPEFVEINWDNKYNELKSKAIDCVWNGLTITEEGKKAANITNAYAENAQVVVMKEDVVNNYKDIASLSELSIAVEGGSAGEQIALMENLPNTIISDTQGRALTEVTSGAADACIIDLTLAKSMTGEGTSNSNLTYNIKLGQEEYGIAFRQNSNITEEVNKIIAELNAQGAIDAIADQYGITLIK